jgi:hypothetical protein
MFSIAIIWPNFKKHRQIFRHGSSRQAIRMKVFWKKLLSYLACSQIWLNLLVLHHRFGYIKKLTKTLLIATSKAKKKVQNYFKSLSTNLKEFAFLLGLLQIFPKNWWNNLTWFSTKYFIPLPIHCLLPSWRSCKQKKMQKSGFWVFLKYPKFENQKKTHMRRFQ